LGSGDLILIGRFLINIGNFSLKLPHKNRTNDKDKAATIIKTDEMDETA
jgi:hypothetical protein